MTRSFLAVGKFAALLAVSASVQAVCLAKLRHELHDLYKPHDGSTTLGPQLGSDVRWTGVSPNDRVTTVFRGKIRGAIPAAGWLDVALTDHEIPANADLPKQDGPTGPYAGSWQRAFGCRDTD